MSSHLHTFIGTYLVMTKLPTIDKPVTTNTYMCSNTECLNHKNPLKQSIGNFCPKCGNAIVKTPETKIEKETTSAFELLEQFGNCDELCQHDGDILTPNHRLKNSINISYDTNEDTMDCPVKEDSIAEFYNRYQLFLKFLDAHEQKPQYEIRFGIINYWN